MCLLRKKKNRMWNAWSVGSGQCSFFISLVTNFYQYRRSPCVSQYHITVLNMSKNEKLIYVLDIWKIRCPMQISWFPCCHKLTTMYYMQCWEVAPCCAILKILIILYTLSWKLGNGKIEKMPSILVTDKGWQGNN